MGRPERSTILSPFYAFLHRKRTEWKTDGFRQFIQPPYIGQGRVLYDFLSVVSDVFSTRD